MSDVVQQWYAEFVNMDQDMLFDVILAANYMDIKPLLDLTCATVASMLKGDIQFHTVVHSFSHYKYRENYGGDSQNF